MLKNAVAAAFAALVLIGAQALARTSSPPLEHMAYSAARAAILRNGWAPLPGNCYAGVGGTCTKFPEIASCSGVSPGFCSMVFRRRDRCLYLGTTGGQPDDPASDTRVRAVTFRRGPCHKE